MPTCLNCRVNFEGRFCSNCGQKHYTERDKSVKNIFEEVFHFLTHFEGTFFTTLKSVILHPGKLSSDYGIGIRKKYYKPVSFYLLVVVLYLLFPLFPGLNMEMKYYERDMLYGKAASSKVEQKMVNRNMSKSELQTEFQHKSQSTSKVLLFLLIPLTAIILYLLYYKENRWMFDNFILATEINAFYILVFFLILPPILFGIGYVFPLQITDAQLGFFMLGVLYLYTVFVFRRVFHGRWWVTLLKSFAFVVLHYMVLQFIYKFIVFEVTLFLV